MANKGDEKTPSVVAKGVEIIKFKNPYIFEDKEYNEITLNFEGLTGADLENAEIFSDIRVNPAYSGTMAEFAKPYLSAIAAISAKVPLEFIKGLPIKEYTAVTVTVQNFLLTQ